MWSAIAATCSALSAFLLMFIHLQNLWEATRPQIHLTGWNRSTEQKSDAVVDGITFQTIRNVGRGVALNIILTARINHENRPPAIFLAAPAEVAPNYSPQIFMGQALFPILASNEKIDLNSKIMVLWSNVDAAAGIKLLTIPIIIYCMDSRGTQYKTQYDLSVVEPNAPIGIATVAPGVAILSRTVVARSAWQLAVGKRLSKVPLLGRILAQRLSIS